MSSLDSDIFRFKGISLLEGSPSSISFFEKDTKLGEIFNKMFKIEVIKFVQPTLILDYVNNWITQNNVSVNSIGQKSVIEVISGFYDYLFLQINGNPSAATELRFEQFIAANDFMTEAMRVVNEFIIGDYYSARGEVLLLDENNYNDKLHLAMTVIFCFRYGASVYFNRNFKMLIPRKDLNDSDKLYFNRLSTLKRAGVYKDSRELDLIYKSRDWPDYPLESLNFPLSKLTRNQNEMKKFMSIYNDQIAPYPKLVDDQRWQKLKTIYQNYYADGKINSKEDDEKYTRAILDLLNINEKFSDDQIISSSIFENDPQKALTTLPEDTLTHILFYTDYRQTIRGENIMELYSTVLRKLSLMDKGVYDESSILHANGTVESEYHMEASIPILFNNMKSIGEGIQGSVELMEHVVDGDVNSFQQALFPVVRKRMRDKNEEVELEKEYIVGRVLSKYYEEVPTIMYTYAIGETWNSISTAVQHGFKVPNSNDMIIDLKIKSYLHDHMRFTDLTKQIAEFSDVNLESKRGIYLEHIDNSNVFSGMASFGDVASRNLVNRDIRSSYIVNGRNLEDHVDLVNYTTLVLYDHLRYLKGKARFLHRDLHANNILIQNYPNRSVALPLYDAKGELSSYLETNVMPRIIDYGFAMVDVQEDIPVIGNFTTAAPLPVFGLEAAAMDFLALYSIMIASTMFNIIDLGPDEVSDKEIKSSVIYSYALAKLLCNDALKIPKIIYPEGDNEIDWTVLFNPRLQDVDSVMNMVPDSPLRFLKFKTFQVLILNMNNVKMSPSIDDSIHNRRGVRHDIHFHKRFRYLSNVFIDYDIDGSYDYVKDLLRRERETARFMRIFDTPFVPQEGIDLIGGRESHVVLHSNSPSLEQSVDEMYLQESIPMMMANVVLRGDFRQRFLQELQKLDNEMIKTRIENFITFEKNFIDENRLDTLDEIKDIAYPNLTDDPEVIYDMAYSFLNMLYDPEKYLQDKGISLQDCQLIAANELSSPLIYQANTTFMDNDWVIRNRIGSVILAMRLMIVKSLKLVRILGILNYLRDFIFVQNGEIRNFVQQKIDQIKNEMIADRDDIVKSFFQNVPSNPSPKVIRVRDEVIDVSGRRIKIPDVAKVFWTYAEKFGKYCPAMYSKDLVKMGVIIETESLKFY